VAAPNNLDLEKDHRSIIGSRVFSARLAEYVEARVAK
jgi:hypothetical protein